MNFKLYKIVENKLREKISNLKLYYFNSSLFMIDLEEKTWVFQIDSKNNTVFWKTNVFKSYFQIFSVSKFEIEVLITNILLSLRDIPIDLIVESHRVDEVPFVYPKNIIPCPFENVDSHHYSFDYLQDMVNSDDMMSEKVTIDFKSSTDLYFIYPEL